MTKYHSRLSASSSSRWMKCAGSIKLIDTVDPDPPHPSALEGTVAHKLCEDLIIGSFKDEPFDIDTCLGTDIDGITVDAEMIAGARTMLTVVEDSYQDGDEIFLEERLSLEYIHKEMFGTCDVVIKHQDTSITVIDFKYGRWPVDPKENSQLIYYLLGARNEQSCIRGTLKIVQPRCRSGEAIKTWTIERDQYLAWEDKFKLASAAVDIGTPLVKGEWCRFCPAKKVCHLHRHPGLG